MTQVQWDTLPHRWTSALVQPPSRACRSRCPEEGYRAISTPSAIIRSRPSLPARTLRPLRVRMLLTSSSSLLLFSSGAVAHKNQHQFAALPTARELTAVHQLPVVQDGLRERLSTSRRTEVAVESERLHDGQVRLDREHGRADTLLLAEDLTTTLVEHRVDTADCVLGTLDLD